MDINEGATGAARRTIAAVDSINTNSVQLEALLVTIMHAARTPDGFPSTYLENVCWLASEIALNIRRSADELR